MSLFGRRLLGGGGGKDDVDDEEIVEIVNLKLNDADVDDDDDDVVDSDDDDEEFRGLLLPGGVPGGGGGGKTNNGKKRLEQAPPRKDKTSSCVCSCLLNLFRGMLVLLVLGIVLWICWILLYVVSLRHDSKSDHSKHGHYYGRNHLNPNNISSLNNLINEESTSSSSSSLLVNYECPLSISKAANDKDDIFDVYGNDTQFHAQRTKEMSVNELLNAKYDAWGITPLQRKALNAQWIHWYADAVLSKNDSDDGKEIVLPTTTTTSSSSIYESACGVGLTLYVILQLLQEQYNITGLEVYGNDYILDDVVTANYFYHQQEILQLQQRVNSSSSSSSVLPPFLNLKKGRICHGDSTNLSFVPSDAFDIVMTGYIDPIVDPLNLGWGRKKYKTACKASKQDRHKFQEIAQIVERDQALVEDWFAAWAGEMIRIAKPGGTIIVESVSLPFCQANDWGGVTREWWTDPATHQKYGWNTTLDPSSIEIVDFDPLKQYKNIYNRYNVKMIKNKS